MADLSAMGPSWDEVRRELFTPEEIRDSDRRVAEIGREIAGDVAPDLKK